MDTKQKPRAKPSRKAEVEALVKKSNPTKVVAYFCKNCGTVYSNRYGTGKEEAQCCSRLNQHRFSKKPCTEWRCEECGKSCEPHQSYCHKCRKQRNYKREEEKLARAEVIPNYPANQGVFWQDNYYQNLEDLLEHCEFEGINPPDRVWATEPVALELNAEDILENALEQWADGCADVDLSCNGEDEFKAAVKKFNEANDDKVLFYESQKAVDLTTLDGES